MTANKNVLVFGGEGYIGRSIISRLVVEGYICYSIDQVKEQQSVASYFRSCDMTDYSKVNVLLSKLHAEIDELYAVIYANGTFSVGDFAQSSFEQFTTVMDINFNSVAYLTHSILPKFLQQGGGKFIFISSVFSEVVAPNMTAYNCSKAALTHFAKSIAEDYSRQMIQSNVISPGFVRSPMLTNIKNEHPSQKWMHYLYGLQKQTVDIETIMDTTVFLLGQNHSINGTNLVIDGGYSIR